MTVRLAVSVEGFTELQFVKQVVAPHLEARAVIATPVPLRTGRTAGGGFARGGAVTIDRAVDNLRRLLGSFDFVTTLYDYYGFRGRRRRGIEAVEAELARRTGAPERLIPYLQRHEFEALLFSDPATVASALGEPRLEDELLAITARVASPEDINENYDTCPSRRLMALVAAYDKVQHGPQLAELIGLDRMRASCPRFDAWLTRIERLGART